MVGQRLRLLTAFCPRRSDRGSRRIRSRSLWFECALAFSGADSYLAEISDAAHMDLYAHEYGRLDLHASYSFLERYGLFFEWHNLNDEPAVEYQGGSARQKTQHEVYGQAWYLGFTVRL